MVPAESAYQIRNPKAEGRKKAETRNPKRLSRGSGARPVLELKLVDQGTPGRSAARGPTWLVVSGFGVRASFGLRPSCFGFPRLPACPLKIPRNHGPGRAGHSRLSRWLSARR